jgi:hypothetical protein
MLPYHATLMLPYHSTLMLPYHSTLTLPYHSTLMLVGLDLALLTVTIQVVAQVYQSDMCACFDLIQVTAQAFSSFSITPWKVRHVQDKDFERRVSRSVGSNILTTF